MKFNINSEIAFTYLVAKKKQTLIASLGVMFGIGMYIFMNSLISGTNEYFEKMTLSSTPHIRLPGLGDQPYHHAGCVLGFSSEFD
jgi:lipoprotein-releasing system permease protein